MSRDHQDPDRRRLVAVLTALTRVFRLNAMRRRHSRVVMLSLDDAGTGGIEAVCRDLSRGLNALEYEVRRFSVARHGQRSRGITTYGKIRFLIVDCVRALGVCRVDFVLCNHVALVSVASWLAKSHRCPIVAMVYGIEVWGPLTRRQRAGLQKASAVWSISHFTREQAASRQRISATNFRQIRLPVTDSILLKADVKGPMRDGDDALVVLSVARLTYANRYKGVDRLLEAWPGVLAVHPSANLLVVGDGDDRPRLEFLASSLDISTSVNFLGRVSDEQLVACYQSASLFCLPGRAVYTRTRTLGEGWGLVFLEAGAHGLPVVAGNDSGSAEAVRDGVTGILVNGSDTAAIASAMNALIESPHLAQRMGNAGRELVLEEHSAEAFRAQLLQLIGALPSKRRVIGC